MRKIFTILSLGLLSFSPFKVFDSTPATLPLTQDWTTTTSLITVNNNWSGVPSIQGFLGDDGSTTTAGIDPQTVLADFTTLSVIANQNNPNTNSTGGVAEFDGIANPTIALQGSGTADFPNIVMYLNTTGMQNITVAYNVRDIDGSADNTNQQVALQYRVGSSGNFTNLPGGYIADATSANTATQVTPVSVVLPIACNNQAVVQVRVITSNAPGSDEWVGIDDINITGTPGVFNSSSSDIVLNTSFSETSNVDYLLYQATDITAANSLEVGQFTIRDGGGSADGDALPTTLTDIAFSLSNSANVRRVAIYDGSTEVAEVAGSASPTFTGLSLSAGDDGSKTFSVRVTFNATVTDNQQIVFAVTSALADAAGSTFAAGNAGGASSSNTADENRIEVTADRLAYVQNTTSPTGTGVAMAPAVTLSANDVNANRDLDFVEQVRITSTGTLSGSPVDVAAVAGLVTFSTLTHTVSGTGFTLNAERTNTLDWDVVSNPFDITNSSQATDYFRSAVTGNWNSLATWESSPDNSTWQAATLVPTSAANNIYIRNTHTVTVNTAVTADQVIIESGGMLEHTVGTFTVNDGSGDDVTIQNGGVLRLAVSPSLTFGAGTPTVLVEGGGTLRVSVTGLTAAGAGVNASNYVYSHQSILEYTVAASFSASGVTVFPNVSTTTIPIFRVTAAVGSAGGGSNYTVKGIFECNGSVSFTGAGQKIFRNGIRGSGTVTNASSGKFVINGLTAELGGTGQLIVPTTGLEIGSASGTAVTVTSAKTVTGDIIFPGAALNTTVDLGNNDLTVTGTITGGGANAYVKTSGTGLLVHSTFIAGTQRIFPIGRSSYNPVTIDNPAGSLATSFSARVDDGVHDPGVAIPTDAVLRTWYLQASQNVANANVVFQYADADCSPGALPQPKNMEILQSDYTNWNLVAFNTSIAPGGANPAWTITGTLPSIASTLVPYTLGVSGTLILPVDCIVTCQSRKVNSNGLISWEASSCAQVSSFEIQRSTNGGGYATIGRVTPVNNQLTYQFTDAQLAGGTNLYRIKINGTNGATKYSNIVAILNSVRGILFTAITPNPVSDKGTLVINAARAGAVNFVLLDMSGKPVRRFTRSIVEGSNTITIETGDLPAGIYYLAATTGDDRTVLKFVKQ